MNDTSKKALLNLHSAHGIGPARLKKLISRFGSPAAVLSATPDKLRKISGIDNVIINSISQCRNQDLGERQLDLIQKKNTAFINYWDPDYPSQLKSLFDAPVFFFFKGQYEVLHRPAIAIVGTRSPSAYGKQITIELTEELVKAGFTIVSGLARGIDTIAHQTALRTGGKTIAVLGGAIDWIYPPENSELAANITKQGGLFSEFLMRTKPEAMNFPKRNRIISGLSLGVLLTEAGRNSGALITAFNALEQNREVFAVPGPVNSERSRGTNFILKEGAKLVENVIDITDELCGQMELFEPETIQKDKPMPHLDLNETKIFDTLGSEAKYIDIIAASAGYSSSQALGILLSLELNGLVRQLPGKMFKKV